MTGHPTTMDHYTRHPEYLAILRGILEHPEDDAYRLALADWIREHGDDDARADFIETQIAAHRQTITGDLCDRFADMKGCDCARCRDEKIKQRAPFGVWFGMVAHGIQVTWARGFPAEVRLTCGAFMGGPCDRCEGVGNNLAIETRREHQILCPACSGTGTLPGLAERLFRAHPITTVRLTGTVPEWSAIHQGWVRWYASDAERREPSEVPQLIYDELRGQYPVSRYGKSRQPYWRSEDDALSDLSDACVSYGRTLAGLPPLRAEGR